MRPVAAIPRIILEMDRVGAFPDGLARGRAGSQGDLLTRPAIHRIQHAIFDQYRRVAFTKSALPQHAWTGRGPTVGQASRIDLEIPVWSAPLEPSRLLRLGAGRG